MATLSPYPSQKSLSSYLCYKHDCSEAHTLGIIHCDCAFWKLMHTKLPPPNWGVCPAPRKGQATANLPSRVFSQRSGHGPQGHLTPGNIPHSPLYQWDSAYLLDKVCFPSVAGWQNGEIYTTALLVWQIWREYTLAMLGKVKYILNISCELAQGNWALAVEAHRSMNRRQSMKTALLCTSHTLAT